MLSPYSPPTRALSFQARWCASGILSLLLAAPTATLAQVAPGGLGTRVNGTALGRCSTGVCTVEGGTAAGRTLFHRFSQYDTRSGIRRVDLDSRGRANVVVGVGHPNGSFFNAPLRLSGSANLFWLSPGGLWFGPTGQIQGATNLLLTTAPSLRIGGGTFTATGGLGDRLGDLGTDPPLDLEALARSGLDGSTLGTGDGPIVLAGGRLSVDRHLLLHSGAGPIRSAPGEGMALEAGRSVQLSGGTIQLQGLDIQAGTSAADDLVRLRSGPLVGGGFGQLSLSDGSLRATRVVLEGSGGLALERVEARAGGMTEAGEVQISAGTLRTAADAQLREVSLTGGQVQVGTRGDLKVTRTRAEAGGAGGSGLLQLAADAPAAAPATLHVDGAQLHGRTVLLGSEGATQLRGVEARAGGDGGQGDLLVTSRPEPDGAPGPMALQGVDLRGGRVLLEAAGDLDATDVRIQGSDIRLEAQGPAGSPAALRLFGASLEGPSANGGPALPAQVVRARASGDLLGRNLHASGAAIVLQAAERLSLRDGTVLRAEGGLAQIQLDALSPAGAIKRGELELQDTSLAAQTIIGRADATLTLRGAYASAGRPGERGIIRFETAPSPTPQDGIDREAGRQGEMRVEETTLTGGRVVLRSGTVQVTGSRIHAPKGLIHLEAKQSDLQLEGSLLSVGVLSAIEDLRRPPLRFAAEGVSGVIVVTPSVGLFAARDLTIQKNSQILASQDLREARAIDPALQREEIQLTDTSGIIVGDAQRNLLVADSTLAADASDNLAGNVILRTLGGHGPGGLSLRNATLSASGGAGSGDIRLSSANGLLIEDSRLQALAPNRREEVSQPGQPDPINGFSGGEITLTNSSSTQPLQIRGSRLMAAQELGNQLMSATTMSADPYNSGSKGSFADANDSYDNFNIYSGGVITLLSSGGVDISGERSQLSVGNSQAAHDGLETIGGTIRIANISSAPLRITDGPGLEAAKGTINLWNRGAIAVDQAQLDAAISATPTPGDAADGSVVNSITSLSDDTIKITGGSLRVAGTDASTTLRLAAREGVQLDGVSIAPVCQGSCVQPGWSNDAFTAYLLDEMALDNFWGIQQGPNVYLIPTNNAVSDQVVNGGAYFADGGVPGKTRSQIENETSKVLFINGESPRRIPAPEAAISNRALLAAGLTDSTPSPPAGAFADTISWQDLGDTALVPLSAPPVLAAAPSPPLQGEESGIGNATTQTLATPAAEQLFVSAQQAAGREVAAALGLRQRAAGSLGINSLQHQLREALSQGTPGTKVAVQLTAYRPAILQLSIAIPPGSDTAQINQILIPANGEVQGWQTSVPEQALRRAIRDYQNAISQLARMGQTAAGEQLARLLLQPVLPDLQRNGINALILSLDRGLQGIPFAALPVNEGVLGDLVSLTVTPAIALTDLSEAGPGGEPRVLLAGASRFANGLAPLPMARQELQRLAALHPQSLVLVDDGFQAGSLLAALRERPMTMLHLATHADFSLSPRSTAHIYTADGEFGLNELQSGHTPSPSATLGLFVLNACRTALGDERQELGITGLALQAGARSALGNLWYVDDTASAAFSIQFHRALLRGLRKDQALQDTQRRFRRGEIRVRGDTIINSDNDILLEGINRAEQIQLANNLSHPYFWSGSILSGSPW